MTLTVTPLRKAAKFIRGITFKPEDVCSPSVPGAVVCMRTKNVQADIDLSDLIAIPEAFVRRAEQNLVEGDLLVSSANSWNLVGKACWVPNLSYRSTAGGFISILRCDRDLVFPRYFYHWVTSGQTQHDLRNCGRQTTNISNLDFDRALDLEIPLPPLAEQKRIASILDKADAIRRKLQQSLRLSDDFLRSVFLDMFGDPVTNPKGWPTHPLKSVIGDSFRNGLSPSSRGTVAGKVLSLAAVTSGTFAPQYLREAFFDRTLSESQEVTRNTFLICRGNGNKSMVGIGVFPDVDMPSVSFPDTVIACTIDRSHIEPEYLQAIWSTAKVRMQIEAGARTTNGTYKVNQSLLGSVEFPVPPHDIQKQFSEISQATRSQTARAATLADEAETLFSTLQQRAFRGEL
jgi:type I restriction enzyme S subunit